MAQGKRVVIVGATGLVGRSFIACLEKRRFPVSELILLASARSTGKALHFNDTPLRVQALEAGALPKCDIALFSAGSSVSREVAPLFAKQGAVVIDNSSAWRMNPQTPLVVPEVNAPEIRKHRGIIANPNCSTIQMVVVLKPLHDRARVTRVVVSTYQAVSGAGARAVHELEEETRHDLFRDAIFRREVFPRPIAFNVIPQIPQKDAFRTDGATLEEAKMVEETKKIMGDPSIRVAATCVRVPVRNGHSESVNVEMERPLPPEEAEALLRGAPGVIVAETADSFPTPAEASGRDDVFVGRVRRDPTVPNGLHLWIVADNILKGAALNAVQIAERI